MHNAQMSLFALALLSTGLHADMVVYENDGSLGALKLFDPNFGHLIEGQSLDITRGVDAQPIIGETPRGSVFFMHILDLSGDFIWMGTGSLTNTARSIEGVPIDDPLMGGQVDYFGPQHFGVGDTVDASANFVEGWRTIHGVNDLTGTPGVFVVGELFGVGIEFQLDGGTHYGFAQFERRFEVRGGFVDVDIVPLRWGFNDTAGEAATVVPTPAGLLVLGGMGAAINRRRR